MIKWALMHTPAVSSLKIRLLHYVISQFILITRAPLFYVCIQRSDSFSTFLTGAITNACTCVSLIIQLNSGHPISYICGQLLLRLNALYFITFVVNVFYFPLWAVLWRLSAQCFTALFVNIFYNSLFSFLLSSKCTPISPLTFFKVNIMPMIYACGQRLFQFVIVLYFMKKCTPLHYTCSQPIVQSAFVKCAPLHYASSQAGLLYNSILLMPATALHL